MRTPTPPSPSRETLQYARSLEWFYRVELADGSITSTYVSDEVAAIHETRAAMLGAVLDQHYAENERNRAVDIACHQGFFSLQLARAGFTEVVALDARPEHVERTALLMEATGQTAVSPAQADVYELDPDRWGGFDLVLMFGLLYHLENPVLALRRARALCRRGLLIETQIGPNLSGPLDYGHYRFVKPMRGAFAIVDETAETHGPETSTGGICLVPSYEALAFILDRVGFRHQEIVSVPEQGYEQLRYGKRIMIYAEV